MEVKQSAMIQKFYNYASLMAIIVLLVWVLALEKCGNNQDISNDAQVVKIDTIVSIDSFKIVHRDTIYIHDIITLPADTVFVPVYVESDINEYKDSILDNRLKIFYTAKTKGELLSLNHRYEFLKPETIIEYRDRIITKTKTIKVVRYKSGLFLGGGLVVNNRFRDVSMYAGATYATKKNVFEYSYNLSNKTHQIGFKRRLF